MALDPRLVSTAGWSLYVLDSVILLLLKINAALYYLPLVFWAVGIAYMFTQFSRVNLESRLGLLTAGKALRVGYGLLVVGVLFSLLVALSARLQSGFLIGNLLIDAIGGPTVFTGTLFLVIVIWWHQAKASKGPPNRSDQ
ncbi:hypothetical protein E6H31_02760 [Candidatus Bathyarchaeota archaeon]|nr:MAG: hypothetical protein E6H31_02760 [Candidatus Bathyarchaeota archaeon]